MTHARVRLRYLYPVIAFGALGITASILTPAAAATPYSEDAVKAAFLYRFAGYVEWPQELSTGEPFTIAVREAPGVAAELRRLLPGRLVQNRPAQVREVSSVGELSGAQILYLGNDQDPPAHALMRAASSRSILIVTDEEDGLKDGGIVNFLLVDRHVRFEVSLTAAEHARLRINSGLLSVAARVEDNRPHSDASCNGMPLARDVRPACLIRMVYASLTHGLRTR